MIDLSRLLLISTLLMADAEAAGPPKGTTTALPAPRLHLVGDSTMADKVALSYPERGWGQLLPEFMQPQLSIINHAANGRSTLRFANEGRWQLLLTELQAGDYVLIQFGHNDQKASDPSRYAPADTTFSQYLTTFIHEVKAKGGVPMLATPICRRNFNSDGKLQTDLLEYANATKRVAAQQQVALFDLYQLSCQHLASLGPSASQSFYLQIPAKLYQQFPEGKIDNTHLNVVGASWISQLFVQELQRQHHPLARLIWRDRL